MMEEQNDPQRALGGKYSFLLLAFLLSDITPQNVWLVPEGFVMLVVTCRRRRRRSGLHPCWLLGKPEAEAGRAMLPRGLS